MWGSQPFGDLGTLGLNRETVVAAALCTGCPGGPGRLETEVPWEESPPTLGVHKSTQGLAFLQATVSLLVLRSSWGLTSVLLLSS